MIPNQQMNTNYSNQFIIDSQPTTTTTTQTTTNQTSPFQNQNFNYPNKPAQYVQTRFIPPQSPGPGPGTPQINPQIVPMQNPYQQQRPTPTTTPASIPLQQSPTSPSVSNYYQYPQYPNQYQYHQPQPIIQQNNYMTQHQMFPQEQVRFNHMMPQQINQPQPPPHQMYQYSQQKLPVMNRINPPPQQPPPPPMPQTIQNPIKVNQPEVIMTENMNHQIQIHNLPNQLNSTIPQNNQQIIKNKTNQINNNGIQVNNVPQTPTKSTVVKTVNNDKQENDNYTSKEINFLINLPLSAEEEEILCDYDSRLYGFLKLDSNEQIFKKYFLLKAINCYEKRVKQLHSEMLKLIELKNHIKPNNVVLCDDTNELNKKLKQNRIKQAKLYLSLGHFYLLLYDYTKSLQSYQKFVTFNVNKLKDSTFYYGLGIVYFVLGAFKFGEKSFLCALYKDSYFQRVNEIHLRLGLIYKELNNFQQSLKHFKLALIDTLSSLTSVSKTEIKFCIAQLYESNHKYVEAVEKYEELFKQNPQHQQESSNTSNPSQNSTQTTTSVPTELDSSLKSKIYRQLGWLYFYSDQLTKQLSQQNTNLIEFLSPFRSEFKTIPTQKQLTLLNLDPNTKLELNRKSLQLSLDYLIKSAQLETIENLTWYYLGRAFTCKLSSREAFISFRNSVNNPNSNSNTWCSIGILYYLQKQYMDSLHAFVCALKSDPKHYASWLNLGVLYEKNNQLEECLKCYKHAIRLKLNELGIHDENFVNNLELLSAKLDEMIHPSNEHDKLYKEEFLQLIRRVKLLDQYSDLLNDKILKEKYLKLQSSPNQVSLPKLNDAFNLDIPSDLKEKILEKKKMEVNLDIFKLSKQCHEIQENPKNLTPEQINLLNNLEMNRQNLNVEQLQLLEHLKLQYLTDPKNINFKNLQNLTFNNDHVKLDPSLTNGSNLGVNKTNRNCSTFEIDLNDDEILNSKINIKMSSSELLDNCKSFGLNGIQNQCLLKPGRSKNNIKMAILNEQDNYIIESSDEESDDDCEDDSLPYSSTPQKSKIVNLNPAGPSVVLENKKESYSPNLQYFCLSNPISVIRGLGNVLRLDLSLFSTKTLVETDPEHLVEVRNQRQQPSDENWDPTGRHKTWKCESYPSYTTLIKYAKYQANSFQEAVRDEKLKLTTKKLKNIKFGTNIDLSDDKKWYKQIAEMSKLPPFMRFVSAGNMLSHVGYKIFGVNTVQMYLKVPGCRTPGHQENNNFCSLNINIGPGDCEWFGVDEKYWKVIEGHCEKNNVDYLNESWWPDLDDLKNSNVPVYRFLQKPGDLVWVNSGCVHWVQSIGWCNNVSWNIGPMVYMQYKSAIERYEWNRLKFYKSIVPMIHLSWNLARNIKITDRRLYEYVKYVLMQSLKQTQLAVNYIENCGCELKYQARQLDEPAHYCYDCECEVFNILFVSEQPIEPSKKNQEKTHHVVHCQACARKRNHLLDNFVILNQYQLDELKQIYDQFQLYVPSMQNVLTSMNQSTTPMIMN